MSIRMVREKSLSRRAILALVVIFAAAMVAGLLAGPPDDVQPAFAYACRLPNPPCPRNVLWRTAAVEVRYVNQEGATDIPVEPSGSTTWNIKAYWNSASVPCSEGTETASATVSWSGSGWTVTNVTTTANITNISVCSGPGCIGGDAHSYGYTLIAQVWDPGPASRNLRKVEFTTTAVSDGQELDTTNCTLGNDVSPTSQTFTQTDNGAFECGFGCSTASGPPLTITYE